MSFEIFNHQISKLAGLLEFLFYAYFSGAFCACLSFARQFLIKYTSLVCIKRGGELNSWFIKFASLALLAASMLFVGAAAAEPKLYGFRIVQQEHVMLHFDLDSSASDAQLFSLSEPHRLVVDFPGTTLTTELPSETFIQGIVRGVRYAQHKAGYLRVVLDLRSAVSPTYQTIPRQGGQRLVIDLGVKGTPAAQLECKLA